MLFLIQFFDEWRDFRLAELNSLLVFVGLPELTADQWNVTGCYLLLELPNESYAHQICERSVLINQIMEFWGMGESYSQLVESLNSSKTCPWRTYSSNSQVSWSLRIESFCKTFSITEKNILRDGLDCLHFEGPINVSSPDLSVICSFDFSKATSTQLTEFESSPEVPCYLGRFIVKGGIRDVLK